LNSHSLTFILLSVVFVSVGQILFKYVASIINSGLDIFSPNVLIAGIVAFATSGIGTLIWIYVIRDIDLSHAYPFMALSFVFIPILSFIFFNETLSKEYFFGIFLIMLGIIFINANIK